MFANAKIVVILWWLWIKLRSEVVKICFVSVFNNSSG
jgi:hypothetical protein